MYIYIYEIYYNDLAHVIMKAKKSQDLHPVSWRPRRAYCSSHLGPKAWELREPNVYISVQSQQAPDPGRTNVSEWVWSQESTNAAAQGVKQEKFPIMQSFCFIQAFSWLDEVHPY